MVCSSPCLRKSGELKLRRSASTSVGFVHGNFAVLSARRCVPTSRESTITCERRRGHHLSMKPSQLKGAKIVTEVGSLGTSSSHTNTPREYRTRVMYTVESRSHERRKSTKEHPEDWMAELTHVDEGKNFRGRRRLTLPLHLAQCAVRLRLQSTSAQWQRGCVRHEPPRYLRVRYRACDIQQE